MDRGVFINYRGADSHSYGALLYTELARRFGADRVFLDCESIPAGADFVQELLGRVRSAGVLLAVIGPRWLTATDPAGRRRIDDPADWIRRELVEAFAAGVLVIPVLTEQAALPAEADLPADIAGLSRCQYRHLRRREPTTDLARLVTDLTGLDTTLAAAARSPDHAPRPLPAVSRDRGDELAEPADQLAQAVGTRWRREEEQRQVHDPFPLPVRWHPAPDDVTDHWENIRGAGPGATSSPLALTGRLDQIVEVYRKIPSGRLVVLGRAGSGKTILTLRFVLDLLKTRTGTDAVPVIFSLGSWNPTTTALRDWLIGQLVRDYPGLAATGPGGLTLAAALVGADLILPVLDGFDEIAEGLHRAALTALNATGLPMLLTSRTTEYTNAVAGTDVLTAAPVVELADLTRTDLADYLPRTTRKAATHTITSGWDPVLTELRDHPHSLASVNLAAVLTTPLMVALARTIYSDTPDRNPATLLNTDHFSTPEALEDHLLANFIPTVYQDGDPTAGDRRRWNPDRVQHWLGYLATHLDHLGTRDLAWWQLGTSMPRWSRTLVIGLVSGLVFGLVDGLVAWVMFGFVFRAGLVVALLNGLLNGLASGFVAGIGFTLIHRFGVRFLSGGAELEPSRVRIQIFGRTRKLHRRFVPRFGAGFGAGFAAGLLFGLAFRLLLALVFGLLFGFRFPPASEFFVSGLLYGLPVGLAVGFIAWLEAPIDIRRAVSPTYLLRTNRTAVVFLVLTWVFMFGIVGLLIAGGLGRGPTTIGSDLLNGVVIGIIGGAGGGLAYGLSLTAWGQWVALTRIWLPLTGRLPWAVHTFLDDAYQRGVLRQVGAVYQFRHARLHNYLTHDFQTAKLAEPHIGS